MRGAPGRGSQPGFRSELPCGNGSVCGCKTERPALGNHAAPSWLEEQKATLRNSFKVFSLSVDPMRCDGKVVRSSMRSSHPLPSLCRREGDTWVHVGTRVLRTSCLGCFGVLLLMSEHPGGHRAVVGPWSSCVASRQLGLHLKASTAAHRAAFWRCCSLSSSLLAVVVAPLKWYVF